MRPRALVRFALLALLLICGALPLLAQSSSRFVVPVRTPYSIEQACKSLAPFAKVLGRIRNTNLLRIEMKRDVLPSRLKGLKQIGLASSEEGNARDLISAKGLKEMIDEDLEEGEDGEGLDAFGARQYFIERRAFPRDEIDYSAYRRAIKHREGMAGTSFAGAGAVTSFTPQTWQFLGPNNFQTLFGPGPVSGRVGSVVYDPNTPTTMYVGAAGGGLWKSTDGGVHYTNLSATWPFLHVSSVAIDPTNTSKIYVGTGDFDGWQGIGNGVMRSTDGGASWTTLGLSNGFGNFAVSKVLLDPTNPATILVALGRGPTYWGGIWRSTDSGATWNEVVTQAGAWSDLAVSQPDGNNIRYFFATSTNGLLYRSNNHGATWSPLTNPLVQGNHIGMDRVACSPTNSLAVYLIDGNGSKVYASTNDGTSWTDITNDFPTSAGEVPSWKQSWWDARLAVGAGAGGDVLYVGLIDWYQSVNNGGHWRALAGIGGTIRMHADQHSISFNPQNANQALMAGDGGVFRFDWNTAADTWTFTPLNLTLPITQEYELTIHPTNPDITLAGSQDNSTSYSNGNLNFYQAVVGGDGGWSAIDPNNDSIQYGTSQFMRIERTTNAWTSWSDLHAEDSTAGFIAPMILDPNNSDVLYCANKGLLRHKTSTGIWETNLGGIKLSPNGTVSVISVALGSSARIYVGTTDGLVWMSQDTGATWNQIQTGVTGIPTLAITSLSVSPNNPSDLLVGLSGTGAPHLWRCTNTTALPASRQWTAVSGAGVTALPDVSLNGIARDPYDPIGAWHVATDVGVFSSHDSGANWTNSTAPLGLPNVQCNDIKSRASDKTLYVATFGRGVWRIQVPPASVVSNINISPSMGAGGFQGTGTVNLFSPAPAGGVTVNLSSDNPAAVVPSAVTVLQGATSATFPVTTSNPTYDTIVPTITESFGAEITHTATITIFPANNASFVSQTVPTSMVSGQTYPVSLLFKNVGLTTWDIAHSYGLASRNPNNNTTWGASRMPLSNAPIAPNATGSFSMTIIAPAAGTYNFQWLPVEGSGNIGFGQVSPNVAVTVTKNADAARYISRTGSTTVFAGAQFYSQNTMMNVGTNAWTTAAGYSMMAINPNDNTTWGPGRIPIPSGVPSVAPGAQVTFTKLCTAPSTPGSYTMQWQVDKNGTAFGDPTPALTILVVKAPETAQFISQPVPSTVVPGSTFTAKVTMQNTGNTTWTQAAGYSMLSQDPSNNTIWGTNRLLVPSSASVTNGMQVTCLNTLTAPSTPGTYAMQWQMYHGGTLFGDKTPVLMIVVAPSPDNAQFVTQKVLGTMAPGVSFSAWVTMKNTGTSTWTQAAGYALISQDPYNNKTWGTNRLLVPSSATVTGGSQVTCSNALIAPVTPGTYAMQWQMYHNGVVFGGLTPIQTILVQNPGDAQYVSEVLPTSLVAGSSFTAKVTMKNTGTTTWTQATGYCLVSQDPFNNTIWGTNRLLIPSSATVTPGAQVVCLNTLKAPSVPGTYHMQWQMSANGVVFGQLSPIVTISVTAGP